MSPTAQEDKALFFQGEMQVSLFTAAGFFLRFSLSAQGEAQFSFVFFFFSAAGAGRGASALIFFAAFPGCPFFSGFTLVATVSSQVSQQVFWAETFLVFAGDIFFAAGFSATFFDFAFTGVFFCGRNPDFFCGFFSRGFCRRFLLRFYRKFLFFLSRGLLANLFGFYRNFWRNLFYRFPGFFLLLHRNGFGFLRCRNRTLFCRWLFAAATVLFLPMAFLLATVLFVTVGFFVFPTGLAAVVFFVLAELF